MPQDKRLINYISMGVTVMHGIIVVCYNVLSCGIYTVLVSLVFGTAIPTSFSILFYTLIYSSPVIISPIIMNSLKLQNPQRHE